MRTKKSNRNQFDLFAAKTGVDLVEMPDKPDTAPGAMDCRRATRQWLTTAIKQSGKSREMVAELLSAYTGVTVSKDSLDMWTKDSHPSDLPAHFIAPLTVILGSSFIDWFAQRAGCRVAGTEQLHMAQIGQMMVIQQYADHQIKYLIADLPLMRMGGVA